MNSLIDTMKSLGPAKLAIMAAITASILAFFIYLMTRLAMPEMSLLYGDLENQDSGQIVTRLEQMKVSYSLSADGRRIMVPREQVGRIRVAMAEDGLPSGGSIGYEIFDRSEGFGQTNFVQNINRVRALEGEISRTIGSIAQIRSARVHLVLPERQLFSRSKQEPSASIVLAFHGSYRSDRQQVLAIQQLVAAAVPGLKPQKVSIVDAKGNLLARSIDEANADFGVANTDELRVAYENRLVQTIEELLARSLGPGNVRVQVTADMDFDRITENSEIYDPDGQVVRSTQIIEESTSEKDGEDEGVTVGANLPGAEIPALDEGGTQSSSQSSRTEETINYETSRTTRTHIREGGVVRRLSVAVIVNGKTSFDTEGNRVYEARSTGEMDQIRALVRSAAGLDEERGDHLEVVNLPFAQFTSAEDAQPQTLLFGLEKADLLRLAEILVLGLLAVLVLVFVVRPLIYRLLGSGGFEPQDAGLGALPGGSIATAALGAPEDNKALSEHPALTAEGSAFAARPQLPKGGADKSIVEEIEQMIDVNRIEGRVRASSIRKIGEIIQKHPDEAITILRNWMYQDA